MFLQNTFLELCLFSLAVFFIVIFDSGLFSKKMNEGVSFKIAFTKVLFYFFIAVAFGFCVLAKTGSENFFKFTTAYFLEMSLSIDNVFVFILIFNFFNATNSVKNRVLLYGVIGAFFLRGLFIFLGVSVVQKFAFTLVIFGVILIATALKILYGAFRGEEEEDDISNSKVLKVLLKLIPVCQSYKGAKFLIKEDGKTKFTQAFLILCFVSLADVLFAVDSIPAVFAVTQDVYLIYTSNILAVLGLRSLFFVINRFVTLFKYLKHGLGIILLAIGVKLCAEVFFTKFIHHYLPSWSMLLFSFVVFAFSILFSCVDSKKAK